MSRRAVYLVAVLVLTTATAGSLSATRLVEVRPVDEQVLMVHFRDGEVVYRDDATGPTAFAGHDFGPGEDELLVYGTELDVTAAAAGGSWTLSSEVDASYGVEGRTPLAAHRKSKVNGTDHDWNYKLYHWIFLTLPEPMEQGSRYTLRIDPRTGSDTGKISFEYDIESARSEAVHVNLIGYTPSSPVKAADLYLWLGDGGARDYSSFEGNRVWLLDVESGERYAAGQVRFWKKNDGSEALGRNLTGSDVWTADFSDFDRPGSYRLVVEGVGASADFEIRDGIWHQPFKTSVRGYYYMRIGEDGEGLSPVPRQPRYLPGKDPEGFVVYLTDLDPFDPEWELHPGDTWDEPHFKPAAESMFWRRRLPGNPTNPDAFGGHSDALDWDRHLGHVSNIYDLLLPYLLSAGRVGEDDLEIAESGNGLPDLIDEARNEVDLWLRLRDGDAYAHGLTNPTGERTIMFQAGATTMAAWANAANAAMLADALRVAGKPELASHYRDEAIAAFRFADRQEDRQLDDRQEVGDVFMRGRDFRMMAAAFLYNVTGDTAWEDLMAAESVAADGLTEIVRKDKWEQTWGTMGYLFSPRQRHYPELAAAMRESIRRQALEDNVRHMDLRPSRRSSNRNYWQTAHNLHLVILAHALAEDPVERARFERAMVLEADWGLGRNPSNTVEMTGLGSRHIVNCYTSGHNDGVPGLHPGHTPYNNLDSWGGTHNGSHPEWFTERGYPDWKEGGWPHQEAFFNSRYSWANGEFTPRQSMRGKMALYGYLYGLSNL